MGTKERREREKRQVRDEILAAARALFAELGYERVTMREIAKRIEYSPTAIYLHFADKQAVIHALCEADFMKLRKQFGKIAAVVDPIERLRETGRAYCAFALKHPNHYRLMFMESLPVPRLDENHEIEKGNPDQDAYAFLRIMLEQAIAEGRLKPEWQDADLLAQMVWAAVHGVVSLRIAKCDDPWIDWRPADEVSDRLCDAILEGILVPVLATPKKAAPAAPPVPRRTAAKKRG